MEQIFCFSRLEQGSPRTRDYQYTSKRCTLIQWSGAEILPSVKLAQKKPIRSWVWTIKICAIRIGLVNLHRCILMHLYWDSNVSWRKTRNYFTDFGAIRSTSIDKPSLIMGRRKYLATHNDTNEHISGIRFWKNGANDWVPRIAWASNPVRKKRL